MRKAYIVAAKRSAIGTFLGSLTDVDLATVGATVLKETIKQANIDPANLDEVIIGNVIAAGLGQNIARHVAFDAGIPVEVCAQSINMLCGSGLKAVMEATQIGDNTVLGSINTSLQEDSKDSPSKEKLNKLAGNIGVLGYSAGAAYSVINLVLGFIALNKANNLNGGSIFLLIIETILFAVTIIIMAVPEGLPMMLALVSSMNSGRLLN